MGKWAEFSTNEEICSRYTGAQGLLDSNSGTYDPSAFYKLKEFDYYYQDGIKEGQLESIFGDNVGNDFVYKDDIADNITNYKEITGQAVKSNPETEGRYHTNWLNMMFRKVVKDAESPKGFSPSNNEHDNALTELIKAMRKDLYKKEFSRK